MCQGYDRAVGRQCPNCNCSHVGIVCHIEQIFICMKCKTEFTDTDNACLSLDIPVIPEQIQNKEFIIDNEKLIQSLGVPPEFLNDSMTESQGFKQILEMRKNECLENRRRFIEITFLLTGINIRDEQGTKHL